MTDQQPIEVGQTWIRNVDQREIKIKRLHPDWGDVDYYTTGEDGRRRVGSVYASNLRKRYTLKGEAR